MRIFRKKQKDSGRVRPGSTDKRPAYSYYQNREQGDDHVASSLKSRTSGIKNLLHNVPAYIAVAVIIGCGVYSLGLTANPKIIVVNEQQQGVQPFLRSTEAYQKVASEALSRSLLNRTKLTINTEKVATELRGALPELRDASLTLPLIGRNPVVYLQIAEPAFVIRNDLGHSFVIDEQGRAVVASTEATELTRSLIVVHDKSGLPLEPGAAVLPASHVAFLASIRDQLAAKNVEIESITLPQEANALELRLKKAGYFLKMNFSVDANSQVGRYLAVKKKTTADTTYVDVRVDDRVYIR